jgi:hypothetical protein
MTTSCNFSYSVAVLLNRIRIGSGFNWASGSGLGLRIQAGRNWPQKRKKMFNKLILKILNVLCKGFKKTYS